MAPTLERPTSEEEVAELLRDASAAGRPVRVLRGHGSASTGPDPEGSSSEPPLLLSLDRMDTLHEHEPADLTATVGAGLELGRLAGILEGAGQWLPVDAPGWRSRRVGGLVAGGRWGPLHLGYGTPRDHVLGATLITGDGRILPLGGRVVKNVAGFDLLRAVVGSRGQLGVVVRATVRLHPLPAADRTLLFPSGGHADLHRLALRLAALPGTPAALEVLGPGRAPSTPPASPWDPGTGGVALRLAGTPGEVESLSERAATLGSSPPVADLVGEASREFHEALSASGMSGGGAAWARFSVLPSHLPELAERLSPLLALLDRDPGGWWATHVRAGILRMVFPVPPGGDPGGVDGSLRSAAAWAAGVGGGVRCGGGLSLGPAGTDSGRPRSEDPGTAGGAARTPLGVGSTGGVHRLREGIRRVFDPAGVMCPFPQWHP